MNRTELTAIKPKKHQRNSWDKWIFISVLSLTVFGLVMIASASIGLSESSNLMYFKKHLLHMTLATALGFIVYTVRPEFFFSSCKPWLILCSIVLTLLLIPGIGKSVNHSVRWIDLGLFSIQPSEFAKLAIILYVANYIARFQSQLRDGFQSFMKPLAVCLVVASLILFEPDFGGALCVMVIAAGMLFLSGAKIMRFILVMSVMLMLVIAALSLEGYRMERLASFQNPWGDPYGKGYQLTQSLIAIGSGGWTGNGLGNSVQKLFYLPEAHTDFIFAIIAEELGFIAILGLVFLFTVIVFRCFSIGYTAEKIGSCSEAFFAYGVGIWISFQSIVNMSAALGLLPTKGIPLPFVSAGGNSLIVFSMAIGMLMRIDAEIRASIPKYDHIVYRQKNYAKAA